MIDREKIKKGLECLAQKQEPTSNPCKGCGYIDRPNYAICVKDIASDALELVKEQETVKPNGARKAMSFAFNGMLTGYCPRCGTIVNSVGNSGACGKCGQKLDWDGEVE